MTDIAGLTIAQAGTLLQNKELSPVELVEEHLQRIDKINPELNAFVTLAKKAALDAARVAEAEIASGRYRGPLHGIPIAHKDMIRTKDLRTTCGSRLLEDYVPEENAFVVECCEQAGAIMLGKTNVHEFGDGPTGEASMFGPTLNPWDKEHMSGGSSSGSAAAVASGLCIAASGSDTGGSIRIPSACCGVVGLKPTYGLVSKRGVFPLCWSLDHVGPICKSVEDAALLLQVMSQPDLLDASCAAHEVQDYRSVLHGDIKGIRIGIPDSYFFHPVQKEVSDRVMEALNLLEGLGAEVQEVNIPHIEHAVCAAVTIYLAEATAYHDEDIVENPHRYSEQVATFLQMGNYIPAKDYIQAQRYRRLLGQSLNDVFGKVDLILTPTIPLTAPLLGADSVLLGEQETDVFGALLRNTEPFNLSGLPSLAMPCGFANDGLPVSMQLTGPPFAEPSILQVAQAYEAASEWSRKQPLAVT